MDDVTLIELFFARSEDALAEAQSAYGPLLHRVALSITGDESDAEECASDALLRAWDAIPPERPANLKAYLCRIARNLALSRLESEGAKKRGGGERTLILDEIAEFTPSGDGDATDSIVVRDAIDAFLAALPEEKRVVFVRRYFYSMSVHEIAESMKMKESRVKMALLRMRRELKSLLEEKGINV